MQVCSRGPIYHSPFSTPRSPGCYISRHIRSRPRSVWLHSRKVMPFTVRAVSEIVSVAVPSLRETSFVGISSSISLHTVSMVLP